jgi:hypothetical protein
MTSVWKQSRHRGGALLVLLALADYADDDGECWPSVLRLASKARLSERQTQEVLRRLEAAGEIAVQLAAGPKGSNLYTVLLRGAESAPARGAVRHVERVRSAAARGAVSDAQTAPESVTNPPLEPPKKNPSRHASRLYPPAVELLLAYTRGPRGRRRPPDPFVIEAIVDVVGSEFLSLLQWGRVVRTWVLRSYKVGNVDGMLRVFREGGFQSNGRRPASQTPAMAALEQFGKEHGDESYS